MEERRNLPEFENSPKKWRYNFTKSLFTFWKNVKMYGVENQRIDEEIAYFKKTLDFFFAEKNEFSILFDGIDVKVDKVRIRGQRQDDKYFDDIYDLFLSLCLSGFVFKKGVDDKQILGFFAVLAKYPVGREPKIQAYERVRADLPPLTHIEVFPYDPEESGNLPIYTVPQAIRRAHRKLAAEYPDYMKMVKAAENIPLRTVERSVQDLISIAQNLSDPGNYALLMLLAALPSYRGSVSGAAAAARTIFSILIALRLGLEPAEVKRTAIASYFQYLSEDPDKGYAVLSRMDDFSYTRIEAALNASARLTDFSEVGLMMEGTACGTVPSEILKVAAYYDRVTRRWHDGPILSRPDALRSLLKNAGAGAFRRDIVDTFVTIAGVYPCGSVLRTISSNELVVSCGRFKNFTAEGPVFVLAPDLSVQERRMVKAENLVDIPGAAGAVLPPVTLIQMLEAFLKES